MDRKVVFLGVLLLLFMFLFAIFFSRHVTFENLKESRALLKEFVREHYLKAVVYYLLGYILSVVFLMPIAALFTLTGGFLFGVICGTCFALIGSTVGATIVFITVRYVLGSFFQAKLENQLRGLNKELETKGIYYLLSLRFFAVIPFFVVNILAGLSKIPLSIFLLTTVIGILPGSIIYAYAGQSLATLESMSDILSPSVLIAFAFLGVLALLPLVFEKRIGNNSRADLAKKG